MTEYTPTTEAIKGRYVDYEHFNSYGMDDSEETAKGFDRWLAQVKAEVWDEAIAAAESLEHFDNHCSPDTCPDEVRNVNPYRSGNE